MRKLVFFALLLAVPALAQQPPAVKYPQASPHAVLTQSVGTTDVTIDYHRPGVKGRQIWGGIVPYGKVWRTGANEATTISFSHAATTDGQPAPRARRGQPRSRSATGSRSPASRCRSGRTRCTRFPARTSGRSSNKVAKQWG